MISKRMLQETCMSAIGSVASAAEQAFLPYAEQVLELMKNFMVLTSDEDLRSRARATELLGIVAMVVGRARIQFYHLLLRLLFPLIAKTNMRGSRQRVAR